MDDQTQEDGMNAYLEAIKWKNIDFLDPEVSLVELMQMSAVPKIPLQKTVQNMDFQNTVLDQHSPQQPTKQSKMSHDNLSAVLQRRRDIANLIILQQWLALLPTREIAVFDGHPLT